MMVTWQLRNLLLHGIMGSLEKVLEEKGCLGSSVELSNHGCNIFRLVAKEDQPLWLRHDGWMGNCEHVEEEGESIAGMYT